jgi:hypothetical protein
LRRQKIEERIVRLGHRLVHLLDHSLVLVRAGDGEHARVADADAVGLNAETAGYDDAAVLAKRLADRLERFLFGAIEEAASVDHHRIGALVARRELIALGAELGDDAL